MNRSTQMTSINWQASLDLSVAAARKAVPYVRAGRVVLETVETFDGGAAVVTGRVQGSARHPYAVDVEVYAEPNGEVRVDGSCSCPVATNCKHVAALLLAWQSRWGATAMPAGARTAGEQTRAVLMRLLVDECLCPR